MSLFRGESVPPASGAAPAVSKLTDSTGGTASTTLAVVGATYSQSELANALASVAKQLNAVITALKDVGITV